MLTTRAGLAQFTQGNKLFVGSPTHNMQPEQMTDFGSSRVSVMTPSIAQSAAQSMMSKTMHASNPNPGSRPRPSPQEDMLKFGRRVLFDRQVSNKEVLENHMSSVKEQAEQKRMQNEAIRQAEREHIDKKKLDEDMREAERQFYSRQLRTDFAKINQL